MTSAAPKGIQTGPHLRRYLELDGVRGIAALAVFFHHLLNVSIASPAGWNSFVRFLYGAADYGKYGVDLFFVLSGFLITSLLIQDRQSPSFYRDFYWKRALRILPLYILTLILAGFLIPGSGRYILISLLFISNFAIPLHISTAGPFWSLAIEEQFYLLWPTIVRRCTRETLVRCAIALWVVTVILRLAAACLGHYDYYLTPLRADGLAAGALIACRNSASTQDRPFSPQRFAAFGLVSGFILICLKYLPQTPRQVPFAAAGVTAGVVFVSAACIALAIYHAGRPFLAWLRSPVLVFFGAISYAFYMLHTYLLIVYDHLFGSVQTGNTTGYFARTLAVLVATTGVCLLTRFAIELPIMSLRRFVLVRPAPPPESAQPLRAHTSE